MAAPFLSEEEPRAAIGGVDAGNLCVTEMVGYLIIAQILIENCSIYYQSLVKREGWISKKMPKFELKSFQFIIDI